MNFSHWFSIESASCDLRLGFGFIVSEALTVTILSNMGIRSQGVWSRGLKSDQQQGHSFEFICCTGPAVIIRDVEELIILVCRTSPPSRTASLQGCWKRAQAFSE